MMHLSRRPIRFLSDWNFLMIPGLRFVLRRARTIPVAAKLARPRWLTFLRTFLIHGRPGLEGARMALLAGNSVGVFSEGRAHRHPLQMLRGHRGAALLSLEARVPILPVGIRFPGTDGMKQVPEFHRMEIHIGNPLWPGHEDPVAHLHSRLMHSLETLSAKKWNCHRT
jgi:1-acyl-sn-glycerol-3-phosphate acyltransferase